MLLTWFSRYTCFVFQSFACTKLFFFRIISYHFFSSSLSSAFRCWSSLSTFSSSCSVLSICYQFPLPQRVFVLNGIGVFSVTLHMRHSYAIQQYLASFYAFLWVFRNIGFFFSIYSADFSASFQPYVIFCHVYRFLRFHSNKLLFSFCYLLHI